MVLLNAVMKKGAKEKNDTYECKREQTQVCKRARKVQKGATEHHCTNIANQKPGLQR